MSFLLTDIVPSRLWGFGGDGLEIMLPWQVYYAVVDNKTDLKRLYGSANGEDNVLSDESRRVDVFPFYCSAPDILTSVYDFFF